MKISIIKTKKLSQIIYTQGYICINGNYIIRADIAQLDDTLLQDKINREESFNYNMETKSFSSSIPDILSIFNKSDDCLRNTNLFTTEGKNKYEVFYSDIRKEFAYFNLDYLQVFYNTELPLELRQDSEFSAACVLDKDYSVLFYLMPVIKRDDFLARFKHIGE